MAVRVMVAPAIAKREVEGEAPAARRGPGVKPRRRRSAVYDAEGNEVFITLMCLKCHKMRPLSLFGLRKMSDGSIRNQPWCRTCRSGAGTGKAREEGSRSEESPVSEGSPADAPSPDAEPGKKRRNVAAEVAAALAAGRG
jgi:hypothetical protein